MADGCSSDDFSFSGGYDSNTEKVALDVVVDVEGGIALQDAINGFADMLRDSISIDKAFFDNISLLEDIMLRGGLLLNLTIEADIPTESISAGNYSDVDVSIVINEFKATALVEGRDLSLDFPIALPTNGVDDAEELVFSLKNGRFLVDLYVMLESQTSLSDLFSDEESASSNLVYGASLDSAFPIDIVLGYSSDEETTSPPAAVPTMSPTASPNTPDGPFGVTLFFNNSNLFEEPKLPDVDYDVNICPLISAAENLFVGLKSRMTDRIREPFDQLLDLPIDFDKVSDPFIEDVTDIITDFVNDAIGELNSNDCSSNRFRRSLEETPDSLITTIQNAITSVNQNLASRGIEIEAEVVPYFDADAFAVGVDSTLSVKVTQSAAEIIDTVKEFFDSTFDGGGADTAKIGLEDESANDPLDVSQLLDDTILSAGIDINFLIEINLKEISAVFQGSDLGDALLKGIGLGVPSWGALASLAVDPINVAFSVIGQNINVRDSSFSLSVELESTSSFFSSAHNISTASSDPLVPIVSVPLSTEIIVDLNVGDVVVSPM